MSKKLREMTVSDYDLVSLHQYSMAGFNKHNKEIDELFSSDIIITSDNPWDPVDNIKEETFDSKLDRFINEHVSKEAEREWDEA